MSVVAHIVSLSVECAGTFTPERSSPATCRSPPRFVVPRGTRCTRLDLRSAVVGSEELEQTAWNVRTSCTPVDVSRKEDSETDAVPKKKRVGTNMLDE